MTKRSFLDVTHPHLIAPKTYQGQLDESWFQGRGSFGGVLTAFAIRAFATEISDVRRRVRTLHFHFCAPVTTAPFTFHAERAREGSRVSHMTGRLMQDGKIAAMATATYAAPRDDVLRISDLKKPSALSLKEAMQIPEEMPGVPVFCRHFDMRFALGQPPYTGATQARLGGYIRLKRPFNMQNDLAAQDALLSAFVDAWPPAAFACADSPRQGASIDLTLTFLHPLEMVEKDAFFLADVESPFAQEGYAQETTHLYSPAGRALVHCRQLVALF